MESNVRIVSSSGNNQLKKQLIDAIKIRGTAVTEYSGQEFTLDLLKSVDPHLVLLEKGEFLDLEKLLIECADKELFRDSTLIVFTDKEDDRQVTRILELGAADVITPSTSFSKLQERVRLVSDVLKRDMQTDIDITPSVAPIAHKAIKVLVVEDDPLLRNLLATKLSASHIEAAFVDNPKTTLDEARSFKPDVIILDIMLPDANGLDLLEEIRATDDVKDTPVIIFSNRDEQTDQSRAEELGANGYYVKAMTELSELVQHIETLAN